MPKLILNGLEIKKNGEAKKETQRFSTPINIQPKNDLEAAYNELNKDEFSNITRNSSIDLLTRMSIFQIKAYSKYEFLMKMGMIPKDCDLTNVLKRNLISLDGLSRAEMVQLGSGQIERKQQISLFQKFKEGFSNFWGNK